MKALKQIIAVLLTAAVASSCNMPNTSGSKENAQKQEQVAPQKVLVRIPEYSQAVKAKLAYSPNYIVEETESGKLHESKLSYEFRLVNPKSKTLTKQQISDFFIAFQYYQINDRNYLDNRAYNACFEPHHFFTFYDSKDSLIGEIQVCLCCENFGIAPNPFDNPDIIDEIDYLKLANLIKDIGFPTDKDCN